MHHSIGFGDEKATIRVYVKNRPRLIQYQQLDTVLPLNKHLIEQINSEAGNGWRKVFNVYAKWLFTLQPKSLSLNCVQSWQQLRDECLLSAKSKTALLFSDPDLSTAALHVIAGRQHAKELSGDSSLGINLIWLNDEFAIDKENNVIVCPYFDYRQLSNVKIETLCQLIDHNLNA
ncbi:DUF6942 family protein [Pseudoalteromonas sp. SSDWG2]|uniref:DUF6942 family protein n=1 Tax=Pseudoalteromonas sp. SSDWG2 TaxID=3139391 RepID=UPI003BA99184